MNWIDPLKEMLRQQKYKDLADRAIKLLLDIGDRSCEWYYLMAQSCYNSWDYERALRHIEMAIDGLPIGSRLAGSYLRFKNEIMTKRAQFARDT